MDIHPGGPSDNITFQNVPFEFSFYVSNYTGELMQKNVLRIVTPEGFSIIGAIVPAINSEGLLDSGRRYDEAGVVVDEQCKQYSGWMECHLRDLPSGRGYGIYFDGVSEISGPLSIKATITSVAGRSPATDTHNIPLYIIPQNDIVDLGVSLEDNTLPGKIAVDDSDFAHIRITNSHPSNTAHATVLQIPLHKSVKVEYIDGCLETSLTEATTENTDDIYNCLVGDIPSTATVLVSAKLDVLETTSDSPVIYQLLPIVFSDNFDYYHHNNTGRRVYEVQPAYSAAMVEPNSEESGITVSLDQSVKLTSMMEGDEKIYTIRVKNNSVNTISNLFLRIDEPIVTPITILSGCASSHHTNSDLYRAIYLTVHCKLDDIPPGAQVSIRLQLTARTDHYLLSGSFPYLSVTTVETYYLPDTTVETYPRSIRGHSRARILTAVIPGPDTPEQKPTIPPVPGADNWLNSAKAGGGGVFSLIGLLVIFVLFYIAREYKLIIRNSSG